MLTQIPCWDVQIVRGNNLSAYNSLSSTDNNLFVWVSRNWGFYFGTWYCHVVRPDLRTKKKKSLINNIGLVKLYVATKPSNNVLAYLKASKKPTSSQSVYDILRRGPSACTVFLSKALGAEALLCERVVFSKSEKRSASAGIFCGKSFGRNGPEGDFILSNTGVYRTRSVWVVIKSRKTRGTRFSLDSEMAVKGFTR